jgi:hypothetical protein
MNHIRKAIATTRDSVRFHTSLGYYWSSDELQIKKQRDDMAALASIHHHRPTTYEDQRIAHECRAELDQLLITSFQDQKRKNEDFSDLSKRIKSDR